MSKSKVGKLAKKVVDAEIEESVENVVDEVVVSEKSCSSSAGKASSSCGGPMKCPRAKWVALVLILAVVATWVYMKKNNIDSVGELFAGGMKTISEVDSADSQQFSYAIGVKIGEQLNTMMDAQKDDDVDKLVVSQAIRDVLTERKIAMTDAQIDELMTAREGVQKEKFAKKAEEAIAVGEKFIIEYAAGENVTKLDGDVLVKELTKGDGALVGEQTANVYYRGKLTDGTEFDSSYKYGEEPVSFNAAQVVPGFGTALKAMRVGDKWEIVIPAEQAYGPTGTPDGTIGPNEVLVFELEIAGIDTK